MCVDKVRVEDEGEDKKAGTKKEVGEVFRVLPQAFVETRSGLCNVRLFRQVGDGDRFARTEAPSLYVLREDAGIGIKGAGFIQVGNGEGVAVEPPATVMVGGVLQAGVDAHAVLEQGMAMADVLPEVYEKHYGEGCKSERGKEVGEKGKGFFHAKIFFGYFVLFFVIL